VSLSGSSVRSLILVDDRHEKTFLAAARIATDLATSPEVAARWDDESACAGMSVGGLAHHLASQVGNTVRLVGAPPSDQVPIPLLEHYARAAWVTALPEDDVNVGIREGSDADAASGPSALPPLTASWLEELPEVLAARRGDEPVLIPWQGWALSVRDWLVTREMEIVVHSDDLASSVGLPMPEYPDDVVTRVLALLTGVAVRRHVQAAVVRALSRPQRAPDSVSAF
jgi:Mycothiol maleylpyruvate isomerase N-terminal domain